MWKSARSLSILVPVLVLLTACGVNVEPDVEYGSVQELIRAFESVEVVEDTCQVSGSLDETRNEYGIEQASCGMHTAMTVYLTPEAKDHFDREWNGPDFQETTEAIITGPNWSIVLPFWQAGEVHEVLGGEMLQGTGLKLTED